MFPAEEPVAVGEPTGLPDTFRATHRRPTRRRPARARLPRMELRRRRRGSRHPCEHPAQSRSPNDLKRLTPIAGALTRGIADRNSIAAVRTHPRYRDARSRSRRSGWVSPNLGRPERVQPEEQVRPGWVRSAAEVEATNPILVELVDEDRLQRSVTARLSWRRLVAACAAVAVVVRDQSTARGRPAGANGVWPVTLARRRRGAVVRGRRRPPERRRRDRQAAQDALQDLDGARYGV